MMMPRRAIGPILGLEILRDQGHRRWNVEWRHAVPPRRGESYPADITLLADGSLELKVKAGSRPGQVRWTR